MKILILLLTLASTSSAFATLPITPLLKNRLNTSNKSVVKTNGDIENYQIGDDFGKHPVTNEELQIKTIRRAAFATASTGGSATSFYLGKFNGHHIMATNHHVFEKAQDCLSAPIHFTVMNKTYKCVKFFGSWPKVDLALFAVNISSAADEKDFAEIGENFAFRSDIYPNQLLVTLGYGIAKNKSGRLMINYDNDCRVFSDKNDFKDLKDPDTINPATYSAYSFSNGCDISHGDSGSAIVDRRTGEVVGILWTAATPKNEKIRSSEYLSEMMRTNSSEIWTKLSYAVPAAVIQKFLNGLVKSGKFPADDARTIQALISN